MTDFTGLSRPQQQCRDYHDLTRRADGYETDRRHCDRHYDRPCGVDSRRPQSPQPDPVVAPIPPPPVQLPIVLLRPPNQPLDLLLQPAHGLLLPPTRCSSSKRLETSIYTSTCVCYNQSSPSTREYLVTLIPRITSQTQGIDRGRRSEEGTRTTASTCCLQTRTHDTIEKGRRWTDMYRLWEAIWL